MITHVTELNETVGEEHWNNCQHQQQTFRRIPALRLSTYSNDSTNKQVTSKTGEHQKMELRSTGAF